MSTRAAIIMKAGDSYIGIYCHNDGYLSHVGEILKKHYTDLAEVKELIELGDISSLQKNVKPAEGIKHSYNNPAKDVTVAYHRDRNDEFSIALGITIEGVASRIDHNNHVYVFEDGKWTHNGEAY